MLSQSSLTAPTPCATYTLFRGSRACKVFVSATVYARRCNNPARNMSRPCQGGAYQDDLPTFHKHKVLQKVDVEVPTCGVFHSEISTLEEIFVLEILPPG